MITSDFLEKDKERKHAFVSSSLFHIGIIIEIRIVLNFYFKLVKMYICIYYTLNNFDSLLQLIFIKKIILRSIDL